MNDHNVELIERIAAQWEADPFGVASAIIRSASATALMHAYAMSDIEREALVTVYVAFSA